MKFFNRKEEVLDIQLTQYGKYLLSQGRFAPYYYAFTDGDILYDLSYCAMGEIQNETAGRIKETPRIHTQTLFQGAGTSFKEDIYQKMYEQNTSEKHYAEPHIMGTSLAITEYAPSWSVEFLKGDLSGSQGYLELSRTTRNVATPKQVVNIPQLDSDIVYKSSNIIPIEDFMLDNMNNVDPGVLGNPGIGENYFVEIEENFLVLEFFEENTEFLSQNFDIEVFAIEDETDSNDVRTGQEELRSLSFIDETRNYNPELSFRNEEEIYEERMQVQFPDLDNTYVEWYFDIFVDEEISENVVCDLRKEHKSKKLFADRGFICPDEKVPLIGNAYIEDDYEDPCP